MQILPNPVKDKVTPHFNIALVDEKVQITDMLGRVCHTEEDISRNSVTLNSYIDRKE